MSNEVLTTKTVESIDIQNKGFVKLEVEIKLGDDHIEKIEISKGENIDGEDGVVSLFCKKHGLDENTEI